MKSENEKLAGRTYSLPEDGGYFLCIGQAVDQLKDIFGSLDSLDEMLSRLVAEDKPLKGQYQEFEAFFQETSAQLTRLYTPQLKQFLATRSCHISSEAIMKISVRGYHLRMLHLEVFNRLMRKAFSEVKHKVVILPHCLRDFRAKQCQFQPGEVDYLCGSCTKVCQINQTKAFLEEYPQHHLFISQNQDLEQVFGQARKLYKDIGLLGVACIPELYEGMLLSCKMNIPAQGVPLNYNRCSRWLGKAHYTNFNLEQLKNIVKHYSP